MVTDESKRRNCRRRIKSIPATATGSEGSVVIKCKKRLCVLLVLTLVFAAVSTSFPNAAAALSDDEKDDILHRQIEHYNYIIGTSAFSPSYQFTDKEPLAELADAIEAWGSNMIKFNAGKDSRMVDWVLEGHDFDYVFMWYRSNGDFRDGFSEAEARADYDAFYSFTKKLLQTYNGTGKQFYLGHWEGDWYYLDNAGQEKVDDTVTQGMIAWLNNRQQAVDDAKRDTVHEDVYVWNYLELNRPYDAFKYGYDRVVNRVLPFTNVDYVSYSAYDVMRKSARTIGKVIDYIYDNLPEKDGVPAPRVWIGEAAQAASASDYNDKLHCEENLRIIAKYLQSDVQFVLYWQMYCNEKLEDGSSNGFWLIDSDGNQTLLYQKLQRLFDDGKAYVEDFAKENGRVPTNREYRRFLLRHPILALAGIRAFFAKLTATLQSRIEMLRTTLRFDAG